METAAPGPEAEAEAEGEPFGDANPPAGITTRLVLSPAWPRAVDVSFWAALLVCLVEDAYVEGVLELHP